VCPCSEPVVRQTGTRQATAACAGVFVHAEAGRRAAVVLDGPDGVIASDVVDQLPHALG